MLSEFHGVNPKRYDSMNKTDVLKKIQTGEYGAMRA
jgi:hypothetical protein